MPARPRIVIVGAGMAGLACARSLATAGLNPRLFDKGRAPGGRVATRRVDTATFDHGCPGVEANLALPGLIPWPESGEPLLQAVASPTMRALADLLATGLRIDCGVTIAALVRHEGHWFAGKDDGSLEGPFDVAIVAVPAPQAIRLYGENSPHAHVTAVPIYDPCCTAMLAFDQRVDAPDVITPSLGPIARMIRDNAKPGHQPDGLDRWVIHAEPGWSAAHLDASFEDIAAALLEAGRTHAALPDPVMAIGHRWRYARVSRPLGVSCLWDAAAQFGGCGDWCLGPTVADAVASGRALAAAVLADVPALAVVPA